MMFDSSIKIIGQSSCIQEVLRTADLVAGTDVPVLIIGDTGTGKDLFANRIHRQSQRKQRPFIKVNCSSLSGGLDEAMLFDQKGYVRQARSGTLFLDEVSDLSASLQARLLHFIETAEVVPPADSVMRKYDVRIIAATQKDLYKEVEAGRFRSDLYYRLNVIPVELPLLKERDGDVTALMDHFFRQFVHEQHQSAPNFTKAALKQIIRHEWPGNVRELQNFCERMFILFSGRTVEVTNLPHEFNQPSQGQPSPFSLPLSGIKLESVEVDLIQQALETTCGNKSQAARLLGLTRDTFLYRLKKYEIDI